MTFWLKTSLQNETEVHLVNDQLSILEYYCGLAVFKLHFGVKFCHDIDFIYQPSIGIKVRIDIWHICFGGIKLLYLSELNLSLQNNYNRNYAWRMHRHVFSRRPRFLAKPDKEMWEKIYRLRHPEQTFPVSLSQFPSFYPNFIIVILSKFYPGEIRIEYG